MGLMVMIVEGVTGVVINGAEKTVSKGGVSTGVSMLAREK